MAPQISLDGSLKGKHELNVSIKRKPSMGQYKRQTRNDTNERHINWTNFIGLWAIECSNKKSPSGGFMYSWTGQILNEVAILATPTKTETFCMCLMRFQAFIRMTANEHTGIWNCVKSNNFRTNLHRDPLVPWLCPSAAPSTTVLLVVFLRRMGQGPYPWRHVRWLSKLEKLKH